MDIEESKQNTVSEIKDLEEVLTNITSSCLLKEIRFYDQKEERVPFLLTTLVKVSEKNPEFILQLALYIRNELFIRSTTNFLVAFSSLCKKTKEYLPKYFSKCVLIPKDLIEICQYVQVLRYAKNNNFQSYDVKSLDHIDIRKNLKLPTCLKLSIATKFPEFSEYQLGKACSDSNRKKTLQKYKWFFNPNLYVASKAIKKEKLSKKEPNQNQGSEPIRGRGGRGGRGKKGRKTQIKEAKKEIAKNIFDLQFLTMKDIIQKSHLKRPQYLIRKVLGVKYPKSVEEFNTAFVDDMSKDPTLEFKEAFAGSRMKLEIPLTWETELSAKGNQPEIWTELITSNKIGYLALIRNLRNILKVKLPLNIHEMVIQTLTNEKKIANSKIFPLQFYSAMTIVDEFKEKESDQGSKQENLEQIKSLYAEALQKALNISVNRNLENIPGKTLIFVDVSASLRIPISGGKSYGSIRKSMELALILGLILKTKSENAEFVIFSSAAENSDGYIEIQNLSGNFVEDMKYLNQEITKLGGGTVFPHQIIRDCIETKKKYDSLIVISDMMIDKAANAKVIKNVEIAFCIDTTGSMGPYIQKAKDAIIAVTEKLDLVTECNKMKSRFGVVAYRDHPPQESSYVTSIQQLTNPGECCSFIQKLTASGGGDTPEAVFDGLYECLKFQWTTGDDTKRILLHVCDAPPHGEKYSRGSSFPKGCPCNIDEKTITEMLQKENVDYKFLKITNETDTMEQIFNEVFPSFECQKINQDLPMDVLAEEMVLNKIGSEEVSRLITEYISKVNSQVKVFSIDIGGYNKAFDFGKDVNDKNLVKIMGTSDNILKFISLRGSISQVEGIKLFSQEFLEKNK